MNMLHGSEAGSHLLFTVAGMMNERRVEREYKVKQVCTWEYVENQEVTSIKSGPLDTVSSLRGVIQFFLCLCDVLCGDSD